MNLAELRDAYEAALELQKAKDVLYQNYLLMKSASDKQNILTSILESGINAYNQGQYEQAHKIFSSALKWEADADAYHNRGTCSMDLGNLSDAIHDFTAAIVFAPTYSPPYTNRGLCFAQVLMNNRALNNPQYQDIKNLAKSDLTKAIELGNADARKYLAALG